MLYTESDITVDAIGDPEAVIAPRNCRSVRIRPKGPSPVINYYVRSPLKTSPQLFKYAGEETIFKTDSRFVAGAIVGYVEMVSGSEDFTVEVEV